MLSQLFNSPLLGSVPVSEIVKDMIRNKVPLLRSPNLRHGGDLDIFTPRMGQGVSVIIFVDTRSKESSGHSRPHSSFLSRSPLSKEGVNRGE